MRARILLVDDNEDFLDSTKDVLEDEGYQVTAASSGEHALALMKKEVYDVILMDIKMPRMNGVEVFIQMKKNNPDIKVIFLTAFSVRELIRRAYKEGARAIFSKPIDLAGLLQTIEQVHEVGKRRCILLADDDRDLCDSLRDALNREGYRVVVAFDSEDAVQKVREMPYDVMLLDMKLPPLDGLEAYRRIKPLQPDLVTIIISGYLEEMGDMIRVTLNENAHTCLPKPIDMDRLLQLLKDASQGAKSELCHQRR